MTATDSLSAGRYVVGVDFGTLSGRALVVRIDDGAALGSAEFEYPHGVIDDVQPSTGMRLPPDWALQDPTDWLGVLAAAIPEAIRVSGIQATRVVALGTDFTACTVLPTTPDGDPLCWSPRWAAHPHAWPKLWRHHSAQPQADRINELAHRRREPWIARYGGKISAEWQFAKALQVLDEDRAVYDATARWIEATDWIVWQLTGHETRSACTAGYKGIYQDGRYPSPEFLAELDPAFRDFAETRLAHPLSALGSAAGRLSRAAAELTGLPEGIVVAVGNVDAHVSAPSAQAVESGQLLAVMGTSTCHVMCADELVDVRGVCGVVDGGIVAGTYGYEAGQSGVGDMFAWWVEHNVPTSYWTRAAAAGVSIHQYLTELGADRPVGAHGLLALDWLSGNRSVLVDHELSGVLLGLTLSTQPEEIYRALLESTAFGTRRIVAAFAEAGVPVRQFVAAGGLVRNSTLMQLYADVLGLDVYVAGSAHSSAHGSAIHAAVAAGCYPDVRTAAKAMGRLQPDPYRPDPTRHAAYSLLYADYLRLHDLFGALESDGGNEVLHRLRRLRTREGR